MQDCDIQLAGQPPFSAGKHEKLKHPVVLPGQYMDHKDGMSFQYRIFILSRREDENPTSASFSSP